MARIESKLTSLGLILPPPMVPPKGVVLPFRFVHVVGTRVVISGHGPQRADGAIAGPLGKVGHDLTEQQGYEAARLTALSILVAELPFGIPVEIEGEVEIVGGDK